MGARMAGKNGASGLPTTLKVPVTVIQPAASSTRKIPDISRAPKIRPKPRSIHQSRSMGRRPKSENGRRSKKAPSNPPPNNRPNKVKRAPSTRKGGQRKRSPGGELLEGNKPKRG